MKTQFDKSHVIRQFNQVSNQYDQFAVVQRMVGQRLLDRLAYIRIEPRTILDLGCGTGNFLASLRAIYPNAHVIGLDIALRMLRVASRKRLSTRLYQLLCGDAAYLPFRTRSFDLIYANLMVHWSDDLMQTFCELRRILAPEGLFLFSTVGPDTLYELRTSWASVDQQAHVHEFMDMHDVGDRLVSVKLRYPVMDVDYCSVLYPDVYALMRELQGLGVSNCSVQRSPYLVGKEKFQAFLRAYERYRTDNAKIPATWEIIYGHCWGALDETQHNTMDYAVSIDQIVRKE